MKIFVSYSSKDKVLVHNLVIDLKQLGHEVWFDQELTGGQDWWDQIISRIQDCELMVFALTPNSLDSYPCKLEYTYGSAIEKRVLPVMVSMTNLSVLPPLLSVIQVVDYQKRDHTGLIALVKALANLPSPRPFPNPMPKAPPAPLSPLGAIKVLLDESNLPPDKQADIFLRLKYWYLRQDTKAGAKALLEQMKQQRELTAQIASEIADILSSSYEDSSQSEKVTKSSSSIHSPEIENRIIDAFSDLNSRLFRKWGIGCVICESYSDHIYAEVNFSQLSPSGNSTFISLGWTVTPNKASKKWHKKIPSNHFSDEMIELHARLNLELNRYNIRFIG
jgi:hypothetical protein